MSASDWLVWQLVDSAFPTGAFAHSGGLESAWQHGEIAGSADLTRFVHATLLQAGTGVLPLVNAAHRDPARLGELDALNDAFLTTIVANRASRVQGRSLLATARRVWPDAALRSLHDAAAGHAGHVAPLAGAVFRALDVPPGTARRAVLFAAARTVLSAAVRLGIAGSYEAQRMQADLDAFAGAVDRHTADADETDLAHSAPLVDLFQGAHDRLYSRLFQS
jgi:urease accessory protein